MTTSWERDSYLFSTGQTMTLHDSGLRDEFETGAVRDGQQGKGRLDLLPVEAILRVARHFEAGANKYNDRNWEKGIPLDRFMDSGLRHALRYLAGERDEDHLAAACWNFLCLIQTEYWIKQGRLPNSLATLPGPATSTTAKPIQLEVGKRYLLRNGRTVKIEGSGSSLPDHPFHGFDGANYRTWAPDGRYCVDDPEPQAWDIVAEEPDLSEI